MTRMLAVGGVPEAVWEEAVRAIVQRQLELAALRLSQDAPAVLGEVGACTSLQVRLPMPAGEQLVFIATLVREA